VRKASVGSGPRIGRAALGLLSIAIAGCELVAFADRDVIDAGAGGRDAGATGGGGAASTSSSGGGVECVLPLDCPGEELPCVTRTCVGGACGTALVAAGAPTPHQLGGDCVREVCDGKGNAMLIADDADVPVDGDPCTLDRCTQGTPENPLAGAGTPCAAGGGKVCDGAGHCVACIGAGDCGGGVCVDNACVALTCTDGKKDGDETDVDCGGPSCLPCAPTEACKVAADCTSQVCSGSPGVCETPSCGDGVQNQNETDVDCGGDCPDGCGFDQSCVAGADCAGGACVAGKCAPTCADGQLDQDETGLDCGGGCAPCGDGAACVVAVDCASRLCAAGVCAAPAPTCADGAEDGAESDVDCGGPSCVACPAGAGCVADADCAGRRCVAGVCAALVLISEVRTRGSGGAHDEFVELYNPAEAPVTLTSSWTLRTRSAIGACETNADKVLFTGAGEVIAAHGHLLLGGSAYAGTPAADAPLAAAGVPDAGSLVVAEDGAVVDALCFAYDAATAASLASCSVAFTCEGAPASNLPHDNTQSAASESDASLEREPGGPLGSARDTGVSLADFRAAAPSRPESAASPPVP